MIASGFRVRKRVRTPVWVWFVLAVVIVACLGLFVHVVYPFQDVNPLYQQVTIDQSVIGDWTYGGEDEEGYLRFLNSRTGLSIVVPPNQHTFDVDGQFVVIENHTPQTLTFAQPYAAIPMKWLLVVIGIVGVLVSGWFLIPRPKGWKSAKPSPINMDKISGWHEDHYAKFQDTVSSASHRRFKPRSSIRRSRK